MTMRACPGLIVVKCVYTRSHPGLGQVQATFPRWPENSGLGHVQARPRPGETCCLHLGLGQVMPW